MSPRDGTMRVKQGIVNHETPILHMFLPCAYCSPFVRNSNARPESIGIGIGIDIGIAVGIGNCPRLGSKRTFTPGLMD